MHWRPPTTSPLRCATPPQAGGEFSVSSCSRFRFCCSLRRDGRRVGDLPPPRRFAVRPLPREEGSFLSLLAPASDFVALCASAVNALAISHHPRRFAVRPLLRQE